MIQSQQKGHRSVACEATTCSILQMYSSCCPHQLSKLPDSYYCSGLKYGLTHIDPFCHSFRPDITCMKLCTRLSQLALPYKKITILPLNHSLSMLILRSSTHCCVQIQFRKPDPLLQKEKSSMNCIYTSRVPLHPMVSSISLEDTLLHCLSSNNSIENGNRKLGHCISCYCMNSKNVSAVFLDGHAH